MTVVEGSRTWDDVVPESERAIVRASGLGRTMGLPGRPAVLVVDVTYAFTGAEPQPVLESIKTFPLSCGLSAWVALPNIARLIATARQRAVPVIYTKQAPRDGTALAGQWAAKNARLTDGTAETKELGDRIPDEIAPSPDEVVIAKDKPSAFFGTSLVSLLNALGVDSLIIAGGATSGCVRATAVDAFSYNYPIAVVEDCTFDRLDVSHKVALFDIECKYGDVVGVETALDLIRGAQVE